MRTYDDVTISTTILSGNLGDGWTDNNAVAMLYGEFMREMLEEEFPGANINVSVELNTTGCGPDDSVVVGIEDENQYERESAILRELQRSTSRSLEQFCETGVAGAFIAA